MFRDILNFGDRSPNLFQVGRINTFSFVKGKLAPISMSSTPYPEENESSQAETVTLTDTSGRALDCYIEHSLEVEGIEYLLLLPVDAPVEIVAWNESESEEAALVEDEAEIDQIFADAQAVLSELNLTLKRTAYTLTVLGELPEVEEDDILTIEMEEEETEIEPEQFQFLASFYHKEQEYAVYTPLDPLLFFAREDNTGKIQLLSPEEFKKVQPQLEELLFDDLE